MPDSTATCAAFCKLRHYPRVTDAYELPVGVVVCVQDPKMDEPWCLVASEATVPTRVLIRYFCFESQSSVLTLRTVPRRPGRACR